MTRTSKVATAAIVTAIAIEAAAVLPVSLWTGHVVDWMRGAGSLGVAVFATLYVTATLLLLPGSALSVGAGLTYGPVVGTLVVSPVSVVAATLAFLLGRTVARGWVAKRVEANPRFAAVDAAVGRSGFRLVTLLRLSPLFPFSLLNYALGLTRIRLRDFVLGSFVGMLPGTFLYVYLGSIVANAGIASAGADVGTARRTLYWAGLAASIIVVVTATRIARRALVEELAE